MSFNAIHENKILGKISEFTVSFFGSSRFGLIRMGTIFEVSFAVLKSIVPPEFWTLQMSHVSNIIRIYQECEGGIEKSVPRITIWHHEACQAFTNGETEGQIFLSHSHTNSVFIFLLSINFLHFCLKKAPWPRGYKTFFILNS